MSSGAPAARNEPSPRRACTHESAAVHTTHGIAEGPSAVTIGDTPSAPCFTFTGQPGRSHWRVTSSVMVGPGGLVNWMSRCGSVPEFVRSFGTVVSLSRVALPTNHGSVGAPSGYGELKSP